MLQGSGAHVSFMGCVGDDESAAKLREANSAVGIECGARGRAGRGDD